MSELCPSGYEEYGHEDNCGCDFSFGLEDDRECENCSHAEAAHTYNDSTECRFCDCNPFVRHIKNKPTDESYTLDQWAVAEAAVEHGERVLLYGPPGTGKTHLARFHGLNGRGCNMITMTEEMSAESLSGHFIGDEGSTMAMSWMYNPGTYSMLNGDRLAVNEIDKACGDAKDILYVLCDSNNIAALTLPKKDRETVTPREGYQVVATMNGTPDALSEALQDRFAVSLCITTPHPKALASLPSDLQEAAAKTVVVADPQRRIGIRKWKAYAHLRSHVKPEIASQAVFGKNWRSLMSQIEAFAPTDERYRQSFQ